MHPGDGPWSPTGRIGGGGGGGARNDPPLAVDDAAETVEGTAVFIDVLANDSDPNGDTLTVVEVSAPAHFHGGGGGGTATASRTLTARAAVEVTVLPVTTPLAVDDAAETMEGTAVFIDVLANDSDPNGDTLTVVEVSAPVHGTAVAAAGTVEYTPGPDFHGTDRFTYVVGDGSGLTARAAVEVTVLPVNDPPLAVDDAAETVEGTAVFIDVLANDSDPNGDTLTVVEVSAPAHGTAVVAAAGTVEYTPGPDFHGTDRLTYVVGDGSGLTARAAVEVTVLPVNDPPLAGDDAADTPEDTSVTIDVLANDSDPDGDTLAVVEVSAPAHGTAVVAADGYGGVHAGAGLSRHRPLDVRGGGRIGADGAGGGGGDGAAGERPAAGGRRRGGHARGHVGDHRRAQERQRRRRGRAGAGGGVGAGARQRAADRRGRGGVHAGAGLFTAPTASRTSWATDRD